MTTYTGDILIVEDSGGNFDMLWTNCQPKMTQGLETYVYLAVFGEDNWQNGIERKDSNKMKSEFPSVIKRNVVNDKTKNDGTKAIEKALQPALKEKIAKKITVIGEIQTAYRIAWQITLEKPTGTTEKYIINWNKGSLTAGIVTGEQIGRAHV